MKFILSFSILLSLVSLNGFAEIYIEHRQDVVTEEIKIVKMNTVLTIRPGIMGKDSLARPQGVNEIEIKFVKTKDGNLWFDEGYARLPKDSSGTVYNLPIGSFDDESIKRIEKELSSQHKIKKMRPYAEYLIEKYFNSRLPKNQPAQTSDGGTK